MRDLQARLLGNVNRLAVIGGHGPVSRLGQRQAHSLAIGAEQGGVVDEPWPASC